MALRYPLSACLLLFKLLYFMPMARGSTMCEFESKDQISILAVPFGLSAAMPSSDSQWKVTLGRNWDVLGPFPIHAREQHYLSPEFPLKLPYDSGPIENMYWPSSLADGGFVNWTSTQSKADGHLQVYHPSIRWSSLRSTEGWSALQHHNLLKTTLTVYPPSHYSIKKARLLVDLKQGSYFTILPIEINSTEKENYVPKWYAGNIYDMERAPLYSVDLPVDPSLTSPTIYNFYISGDYEIRLFGDPRASGRESPVLSIDVLVQMDPMVSNLIRERTQDVVCDFIDGFAFGKTIGIAVRSVESWWTVKQIRQGEEGLELLLPHNEIRIAPSQTRVIPFVINQKKAIKGKKLTFSLVLQGPYDDLILLPVELEIRHISNWNVESSQPIKATYLYAGSQPTAFAAIPPKLPNDGHAELPVLALHGAGVDIFNSPFWLSSIPRQSHKWIIFPTGRTSWGLDWHGPSATDAWSSVEALSEILNAGWKDWSFDSTTKVILVGHSNGGQGAWYLAAHYPDRVFGVVAAAAYLKSQQYVALTHSRAGHYIDPSLRAILESSLTPDDNDLFLSNIAYKPILAIHGGDDENVPVWHSREYASILHSWGSSNVTFIEDPGQPHWYPTIFQSDEFQNFLSSSVLTNNVTNVPDTFTLTVAQPTDSGSMYGWKIETLVTPGRLSRLHVSTKHNLTDVRTVNVRGFSISLDKMERFNCLKINNITYELEVSEDSAGTQYFNLKDNGHWAIKRGNDIITHMSSTTQGRLLNFLSSSGPIIIIIPQHNTDILSMALRLAHNLYVYHRLDAEIWPDVVAITRIKYIGNAHTTIGNIVSIGGVQENSFSKMQLQQAKTEFYLLGDDIYFKGRPMQSKGLGLIFTHPHPTQSSALMLFMLGTDMDGLERALRLFPLRTGVPAPDWIMIGEEADRIGSAGVLGAGVWSNEWRWNEAMSWLP